MNTDKGKILCSCDHDNTRRDFLKTLSLTGAALTGIPTVAGAISGEPGREKEWSKSAVIREGKVKKITLLHTADIHSQLYTHDEFFWENGKPVYKKRGGFAVLKTMLNTLRKDNPGQYPCH